MKKRELTNEERWRIVGFLDICPDYNINFVQNFTDIACQQYTI